MEVGDDNDSIIADADGEGVAITKQTDGMMVPSSFNDMFLFNAAVMGLTNHDWMTLILDQLDAIANNVSNPYRLQEECDVLALVLSKYQGPCPSAFALQSCSSRACESAASCQGTFVLSEFKAVVLASLRSLVSTEWDSEHEVAQLIICCRLVAIPGCHSCASRQPSSQRGRDLYYRSPGTGSGRCLPMFGPPDLLESWKR